MVFFPIVLAQQFKTLSANSAVAELAQNSTYL
jgi:hypothetical protein